RLAETYLIVAEAYGRQENYEQALPYINEIRKRAAYKQGEDRSDYVDGGVAYRNNAVVPTTAFISYSDKNTYYESNNIAETTATTEDAMILNSTSDILDATDQFYDVLGTSSNREKFLAFILNERSRERMGELMRWEDLARTKTLIKRNEVFHN